MVLWVGVLAARKGNFSLLQYEPVEGTNALISAPAASCFTQGGFSSTHANGVFFCGIKILLGVFGHAAEREDGTTYQ